MRDARERTVIFLFTILLCHGCTSTDVEYYLTVPRIEKELYQPLYFENEQDIVFLEKRGVFRVARGKKQALEVLTNDERYLVYASPVHRKLLYVAYDREKDMSFFYLRTETANSEKPIFQTHGRCWSAALMENGKKIYYARDYISDGSWNKGEEEIFSYDFFSRRTTILDSIKVTRVTGMLFSPDESKLFLNISSSNDQDTGLYYLNTSDNEISRIATGYITSFVPVSSNQVIYFDWEWTPEEKTRKTRLFLLEVSSSTKKLISDTLIFDGEPLGLALSPILSLDGSKIAFISRTFMGQYKDINHLMEVRTDGTDLRRIPIPN